LASAMTRALMFADASVAEEVDGVTTTTTDAISQAIAGSDREPDDEDRTAAMVLEQVWFSSILKWQSGRATIDELEGQLRTATRLLLR
ncbi:MAG: TetR family transcriptional regulator, partial [Actinobacteria bacterium]|nr:TetR family transcriptional regulator [Actinomycetota bacterium]